MGYNGEIRPTMLALFAGVAMASAAVVAFGSPANADKTTNLTIRMPGCNGCKVTAVHSVHPDWNSIDDSRTWRRSAKVSGGVAKLRVPTSRTRGLSFQIYAGKYNAGNSVPMVALHYAGRAVGSRVNWLDSSRSERGSYCWAGTDRSRATLKFRSERWVDKNSPPAAPERYRISVWASPTVTTLRDDLNMFGTNEGGLGIQQGPYCFDPRPPAATKGTAGPVSVAVDGDERVGLRLRAGTILAFSHDAWEGECHVGRKFGPGSARFSYRRSGTGERIRFRWSMKTENGKWIPRNSVRDRVMHPTAITFDDVRLLNQCLRSLKKRNTVLRGMKPLRWSDYSGDDAQSPGPVALESAPTAPVTAAGVSGNGGSRAPATPAAFGHYHGSALQHL